MVAQYRTPFEWPIVSRYCLREAVFLFLGTVKKSKVNPFMPNCISHRYQLEQSISVLRDVGCFCAFFFHFYSNFIQRSLSKQWGS